MRVYSTAELQAVDYHERPDGFADIRLRRNIQKVAREQIDPAGEATVEWQADEQYVLAAISKDEAAEAFDQLWEQAVRDGMTLDERIDETEQSASDSGDALAELGDMIAEQQSAIEDQEDALAELGDLVAAIKGGE